MKQVDPLSLILPEGVDKSEYLKQHPHLMTASERKTCKIDKIAGICENARNSYQCDGLDSGKLLENIADTKTTYADASNLLAQYKMLSAVSDAVCDILCEIEEVIEND